MDYNKEKKLRYIKSGSKWFDAKRFKGRWDDIKYFNDKEAVLLDLEDETEKELLKKLGRKNKPQVIIIDGVDGIGKSTIVENIIKQLGKEGLKVRFNTFKRRRNDDERFRELSKKYEWLFRKQVVEEINRRMIKFTDEDIVVLDKSPYCEYFYQKTERREMKKNNGGHKASYETLNKKKYMDMVKMFKEHQNIYENEGKYRKVEIKNDNKSWEKVYKQVERLLKKQNDY
ncbi:hypothetical protein C1645_835684 [Glomus cerebriforme]|uniref:Thymidylate kinase-like domain-containing protein n=1 Tax=Glomus cerebriforme TaxID=658196 RepID=A0A397S8E6_9GLOM|nr:hypothetical protein C1645_835684 [Glomus cerebriforme]